MQEPNYTLNISRELALKDQQVGNVLSLIDDGCTVHFIARYRKERTGNLNENVIREIIELKTKLENIYKTKVTALTAIAEQGKLTEELQNKIENAQTLVEVEDLYAPYKRKKKTKADIAREKGFDVVAQQIKDQQIINIPQELLALFPEEEIITGSKDIVSQDIADNPVLKDFVRQYYVKYGKIVSKAVNPDKLDEKQKEEAYKFKIYQSFGGNVTTLKSYQTLALNRGDNLGILNVGMDKDDNFFETFRKKIIVKPDNTAPLEECVKDGYGKIFASIEREVRNILTEKANIDAIKIFQANLKELLMLKPHYGESVLAIDPGYRTGCKICILDKNSAPVYFSKIFLDKKEETLQNLKTLFSKHKIDVITIGNGTASGEIFDLIKNNFDCATVLVNESGASVYSTSEAGQEEFPALDATDRGTISIGRRYVDSLSEFVKIPVISVGVGMYQHDMNQKELERKLSDAVEDVVNLVGINVNGASTYLLSYVSGLSKKDAKKIFENKPYKSREQLKKLLGKKAYEQGVGFLRVPESENVFDRTAIHPEQYKVASFIIEKMEESNLFSTYRNDMDKLYPGITNEVVLDIISNYKNAGKELRQYEGSLKLRASIKIEDLKIGDMVEGIVRNVTQFGAFVDIGLKNNALIHISQLADRFIKNPLEVVSIGEELKAKVLDIDIKNGRISLSLKH
ncbi:MAG: Tex-like N-terminal domain-containing protein [bacterium]|nr:Tex-like N-terminal domain-containing protein [bacterium]